MSNTEELSLLPTLRAILDTVVDDYTLKSLHVCGHQLKSHAATTLVSFSDARHWEISVDYFALAEKRDGSLGLVLVNVSKGALGLTELGELHAYSRAVKPLLAVQIAPTGLSRDLYSLLLRPEVSERLLKRHTSPIWIYAGVNPSEPFSIDAFFPPLRLG
ncbi:MAG: hypothetical protein RLZZ249_67 [Actinomycetota bacterium]|jgi:hypothetical protein